MQSNANYSNGYTRLPIKIPETILEIVSGHLFESDFRPYFKMFLDDPLGYTLKKLYFTWPYAHIVITMRPRITSMIAMRVTDLFLLLYGYHLN